MNTLLRSVLVAALLMAGCARDVGEQFVGKWVDVTSEKNVLSIEHNGESFIIRDTRPELFGNGVKTRNHPALLTNGVLQVSNGSVRSTTRSMRRPASSVQAIPSTRG